MYKEKIYNSPNQLIRTDGYYLEIDSVIGIGHKSIYVFLENGYVMNRLISVKYKDLKKEISKKIKRPNDTIYQSLNWWRVENDSLSIEIFGDIPYDIISSKWMERGKIINDALIELDNEGDSMGVVKYEFVKCDSMIRIINDAGYMNKKWYLDNLHEDRK